MDYSEIYDASFPASHLKKGLAKRYFLRKVSPFVLIGSVFFTLWICQMILALAHLPVVVNILR